MKMAKIWVAKFQRYDWHYKPALQEFIEVPVWHQDQDEAWAHLHMLDRPIEHKSSWGLVGWKEAEFTGEVDDEEESFEDKMARDN